ncbi:leucine-rich repeat domain-containing protein [Niabella aurantiaca]|uniref:leucine-rich repeat domain-containing protein n=1 Tax=Niabella aurantiaca TaxID=379900 RepID=UPI00035C58F3|nr:leucine-rich repeat domain-containing protein [Niabella aurantiaca]
MIRVLGVLLLLSLVTAFGYGQAWGYAKGKPVYRNIDSAYRHKDSVYNLELSHKNVVPEKLKLIGEMPNIEFLFISSSSLSYLPEEIFKLKNVRRLALWGSFETIPKGIRNFEKLELLSMPRNGIREIPDWIGALKNLQGCYLPRNQIEKISGKIGLCRKLRHLNLSKNQITHIPGTLAQLTGLEQLELDGNQLSHLPEAITTLTKLTKLSASNNHLVALPGEITRLRALDTLLLPNNRITELPAGLDRLVSLKLLDLSFNPLTDGDFALPASLKGFLLVNSKLAAFPESLRYCPLLEELWIVQSGVQSIPYWLPGLKNLKELNLRGNRITGLPVFLNEVRTLTAIDLANNFIDSIPSGMLELPSLKRLDISWNPVRHIPDALPRSKSLQYFSVSNTKISLEECKQFIKQVRGRMHIEQNIVYFISDENHPCYPGNEAIIEEAGEPARMVITAKKEPDVFTKAEMLPAFMRGDSVMSAFFNSHLLFPQFGPAAANPGSFADTVILRFIVHPRGGISGIRIQLYKTAAAKAEAVRLVKLSCPYWRPAVQGGREVKAYRTLALIFRQVDEREKTLTVEKLPY